MMYLVQESFEGRIVWRMGRWEDLKKEFEVHRLSPSGLAHESDVLASNLAPANALPARLRFIYFKGPTAKDLSHFMSHPDLCGWPVSITCISP